MQPEVIEDEQRRFFDLVQEFDIGAIKLGDGDALKEPVHTEVEGPVTQRAGLPAEGAGQIAFTASGCAGDEEILAAVDKGAVGKRHELLLLEIALLTTVNLLKQGVIAQLALAEVERGSCLRAFLQLSLGQSSHKLADGGLVLYRHREYGLISLVHTVQAEFFETIDGKLGVHGRTGKVVGWLLCLFVY